MAVYTYFPRVKVETINTRTNAIRTRVAVRLKIIGNVKLTSPDNSLITEASTLTSKVYLNRRGARLVRNPHSTLENIRSRREIFSAHA